MNIISFIDGFVPANLHDSYIKLIKARITVSIGLFFVAIFTLRAIAGFVQIPVEEFAVVADLSLGLVFPLNWFLFLQHTLHYKDLVCWMSLRSLFSSQTRISSISEPTS